MNQRQLAYFAEVFRCKNIQSAAGTLFISRQGVSKVIRSLEEELGQNLFIRTSSGVAPTDFAIALYPHALKLLDEYSFIEGMNTLASQKKNVLTIYAMDHFFAYLSADFLIDFRNACPDVTLSILDTSDDQALDGLLSHKCQLAIVNGPLDFTQFRGEELFYSRYCARLSKEHPLAKKPFLNLSDLNGETIAGKGRSYRCFRTNIDRYLLQPGYQVDILAEISDEEILTALARKNQAIVIGYDYSASLYPKDDLAFLPLNLEEDGQSIYLAEKIDGPSGNIIRIFKDFLIRWIQEHHKDRIPVLFHKMR